MTTKMDEEFLRQVEESQITEPQREIPVIVTIKPNTDLAVLQKKGLKVHRTFSHIPAVAGTLNAAAAHEVAQLDEVELIEYDGEVHAL